MQSDPPSARLLDLSRLLSRAGRVMTGVDRVERAYLGALIASDVPAYGLIRTPIGFLLLDESGLKKLLAKIDGEVPWGPASRFAKVFSKLPAELQRALTDARKLALARSTRRGLGRMLKRHLPERTAYFNTGHSNLTDYVTAGVKALRGSRIVVFVHDTIPLEFPHFQRDGSVERFKLFLGRVAAKADLVIYNSRATQQAAEAQLAHYGRVPKGMVAHLGVDMTEPDRAALPEGLPFGGPYFLCVGTIEPRKNHLLLIDVWEQMEKQTPPQDLPQLLICGQRGWKNDEFFFRFENSRLKGRFIHEVSGLSDGAISALLEDAAGVVFPSLAEGYGLPALEAAARGVPVICADLPVYKEVLGDIPVYASVNDSYLWIRRVLSLAESKRTGQRPNREAFAPPTWDAHFNLVLSET
ncbi:glycosyltransferase family 1 protein [uncultured Lentibacter sp.]|uniref:glycosyltransferase family 4 protein n=1 Tax=uncultured Lentibacter sp. TaxID=1659309 RepID=UPI002635B000|nr:glycosyltransferase family 1 protein [uncultured Lentibacter sp.]